MAELTTAERPRSLLRARAAGHVLRAEREGRVLRPRRGLRLRRRRDRRATAIREQVRERYAAAAAQVTTADPGAGCCAPSETFDGGSEVFGAALYALGDREQLPDTATLASLGCGNPTAVAELHEGETVLDLGSGGGHRRAALRQARRPDRQGPRPRHDRRDACPRPRERRKAGVENVEFHKGYIEAIPLPDASVDVVISNCVINLSGDKPKVLREVARVLRPGGRFADLRCDRRRGHGRRHPRRHAGVHGLHRRGAHPRRSSNRRSADAGLVDVEIARDPSRPRARAVSAIVRARKPGAARRHERPDARAPSARSADALGTTKFSGALAP